MSALLAFVCGASLVRGVIEIVQVLHRRRVARAETKRLKDRELRRYEWRNPNGSVYLSALAADACVFWLAQHADGKVSPGKPRKEGEPDRSLRLFVSLTGEQVAINGTPGVKAELAEVKR